MDWIDRRWFPASEFCELCEVELCDLLVADTFDDVDVTDGSHLEAVTVGQAHAPWAVFDSVEGADAAVLRR